MKGGIERDLRPHLRTVLHSFGYRSPSPLDFLIYDRYANNIVGERVSITLAGIRGFFRNF